MSITHKSQMKRIREQLAYSKEKAKEYGEKHLGPAGETVDFLVGQIDKLQKIINDHEETISKLEEQLIIANSLVKSLVEKK